MREFENLIEGNNTVHYKSRVIASFVKEGGGIRSKKFDQYLDKLIELGWILPADKHDIKNFATNGKLELETIAREILKEETE